jgi:ATP-binding cassette subfamily B protein
MTIALKQYQSLLLTYLKPQWPKVLLLALLLMSEIGFQLINPQILRYFIDTAQTGGPLNSLIIAALIFLGIVFAGQLFSGLATYFSEDVGWTATNRLREDIALHCLRLDMSFHKTRTPGEMIERINGDVATLSNFFSQFVILVLGNMLFLIGILILVIREDWRLGLALLAYTLIALLLLRRMQGIAIPYFKAYREAVAKLSGFWEERLIALEDIRSSGVGLAVLRGYHRLQRIQMLQGRKAQLMGRTFQSVSEVLASLGLAATFAVSAYLLQRDSITLGTVYLVFYYTNLHSFNISQITQQINDLQSATAGMQRIRELYFTRSAIQDIGTAHLPAGPLAVEFQDVSFSYVEGSSVLQNVTFHLAPGEVLGVLGRTGSGKTTLTRLIPRFYDPNHGTIRLGGQEIHAISLAELRQHIGVVTQEVQLFHSTLRSNLTVFNDAITDAQLLTVIQELGLWAWYRSLPNGLDTTLAPGGGLSAGEAQLLALTRVFLKDPGLIILDEASSRLDLATEHLIEHAINRLLRKRTGIVVAHRLTTIQSADKILMLEDGQIREYGDRARLAANPDSRFSHLLQMGLEEATT